MSQKAVRIRGAMAAEGQLRDHGTVGTRSPEPG
jgi:hypothetical protein